MDDVSILSYHIKHSRSINCLLYKAKLIVDYAVENKSNKKLLSSKYVKHIGLPSAISNQLLRQYGRGTIKEAHNVNLIVPNQKTTCKTKNGIKIYNSIIYKNGVVHLKPLKMSFRWNPGREFLKINQVTISDTKFMVAITIQDKDENIYKDVVGIDLNCGVGRHIAVVANSKTKEVLCLGKQGPNIRKMYKSKRRKNIIKNNKEHRIMKDIDHKISNKIVNYALKNKLIIVIERLTNIRKGVRKGKGSKEGNRVVNSWSFYRLQSMIEYKSKERGIACVSINPHYTSQLCSYCGIIGSRNGENFVCKNNRCCHCKKIQNSDINAAFNICKRVNEPGGISNT